MKQENWKPIPGFEGRYEASDLGRVRSVGRWVRCGANGVGHRWAETRVLRPAPSPSGHLSVALGKGNTVRVHVCVALAFIGAPPSKHEVLHADHNPSNNVLGNLRYGTRSENLKADYAAGTRRVHPNFIGARWKK